MELKVITSYNDFLACRDEWNKLIEQIDKPEVFYLHEWADSYIKYYEADLKDRLYIIQIYEGGKIAALFPFVIVDKVLTFITRHTSDYNTIYIDSEHNKFSIIKKGFEYVLNNENIKSILLTNIPSSSELYFIQEVLRELKYSAFLQESVMTPYFEKAVRRIDKSQKKHIKDIERRERRFKESERVEYTHSNRVTEAEWDFIIKFKAERYKDAQIAKKNVQEFYKELVGSIREYVLADMMYVNRNLAAAHIGFLYKSKIYYYMPAFDGGENGSGMGLMLLNDIINNVNYDVFDSLIGNEKYKFYWCDQTNMNYHLMAYKNGKENIAQAVLISLKNTKFIRKIFGR